MNNKDLLLAAATAYYNGHNLIMSDEDYDKLLAEEKENNPNFNIFNEIVIGNDRSDVKHYYPYTAQAYKKQFTDMKDFLSFVSSSNLIWTYKLDGCSITAYYSNGVLIDILTRSDEYTGKRKYDQLKNKVPMIVDPDVYKIDFEAVCSKEDFGDDIRSNANGLINSCYMQDDVDKYINLIPFKVTCNPEITIDYLRSFDLAGLSCKIIMDNSIDFDTRYVLVDGKHYPIDGFVGYRNTIDPHEIWKHYSNQNIVTTVTNIDWKYQASSWAWTPKIQFNEIKIDGRNCWQATSNGLGNLRDKKCGIGSEISVFLANSTIPMVGNVYKESENYNIPSKCPYCGEPLEEIQNKFRCSNRYCNKLVYDICIEFLTDFNKRKKFNISIPENLKTINEFIDILNNYTISIEDFLWSIGNSVMIERFKKYDYVSELFSKSVDKFLIGTSVREIIDCLTGNQYEVYKRHSYIVDEMIRQFLNIKGVLK